MDRLDPRISDLLLRVKSDVQNQTLLTFWIGSIVTILIVAYGQVPGILGVVGTAMVWVAVWHISKLLLIPYKALKRVVLPLIGLEEAVIAASVADFVRSKDNLTDKEIETIIKFVERSGIYQGPRI